MKLDVWYPKKVYPVASLGNNHVLIKQKGNNYIITYTTSVGLVTADEMAPLSHLVKGVRLQKLDAPTFDGKFTNWILFWEDYDIAIHRPTTLSDVHKLAYLCSSLKDGSANGIIDGFSTSCDFYTELIETLKA